MWENWYKNLIWIAKNTRINRESFWCKINPAWLLKTLQSYMNKNAYSRALFLISPTMMKK
jgi:hypothetical protein